jgi:hypothetical protein
VGPVRRGRTGTRWDPFAGDGRGRGGTRSPGTDGDAVGPVRHGEIVIELPSLDPALLSPAAPYGGGDFELAAYLFQEALVTRIGLRCGVPAADVDRYHVH